MSQLGVDIVGTNAERYINQQLKDWVDFRRERLANVTADRYVIRFYFEPKSRQEANKIVIAKQFSKKKYASCDEGIKKFAENGRKKSCINTLHEFQWQKRLVIEQENYWLVIFEERR